MPRLLLLAFIWGWSFLFIKVGVQGMTPTAVAGARIALGAMVLAVVVRWRGLTLPRDRSFWLEATLTGLTGNVLPFSLLAWGEERITSALTSVLNAATPLFTAIAVAALLGERLRWSQVLGLGVGLAGVAYAAGVGGDDFADSSLTGSAAAVLAGVCYAVAFVQIRNLIQRHPPEVAAAGQLVTAAIILAPVAIATSVTEGIDLEPHRVLAVLLLGLVGTGIAYVLNYRIVAELGPTKASLVTYVIPVVAVTVGVVFLDERFHVRLLLGGALIVVGISLVNQRLRLPRRVPVASAAIIPLLLLVGCGDSGGVACDAAVRERLDPSSAVHVLPGAPESEYLSDPPTSGVHRTGPPPEGVLDEPLDPPSQVGALEQGVVLVQHRDLDTDERRSLEELADGNVVVAPNPDLPSRIVFTAWTAKQRCHDVDRDALRQFVENAPPVRSDQ